MPPPATINSLPSGPASSSSKVSIPLPNPVRLRSYILRLPLFTRLVVLVIILLWLLELQTVWSVITWGRLEPNAIGLISGGMYRLNTYPVVHMGFWHMIFNLIALVGLLERFEMEWGTLTTLALFVGRESWTSCLLCKDAMLTMSSNNSPFYTSGCVIHPCRKSDTEIEYADIGCKRNIWIFLLLGIEAIKTYRANPYFDIAGYKIPTWISPLALILVTSALISGTSLLGHLCGCFVGYMFGLGYLKFLAPPDKILRWIEAKLNLLGRLPHYVSVDQKTYGRYGVLPSSDGGRGRDHTAPIGMSWLNRSGQRLGP